MSRHEKGLDLDIALLQLTCNVKRYHQFYKCLINHFEYALQHFGLITVLNIHVMARTPACVTLFMFVKHKNVFSKLFKYRDCVLLLICQCLNAAAV